MYYVLACLIVFISGCVHDSPVPHEWLTDTKNMNYTGSFSNTGQIDAKSASRGFYLRMLTGFFWPGSRMDADTVKLTESSGQLEVQALKGMKEIARTKIALTNGELILIRSGTDDGGVYKATDRFIRNQDGLVVESVVVSAGVFIIPLAGKDKAWYFYPLK
jgi:hypothetical protein